MNRSQRARISRNVPWMVEGVLIGVIAVRTGMVNDAKHYVRRRFRPPLRPSQPVPILVPTGSRWWDRDGYRPAENELVVYVKPRHVASLGAVSLIQSAEKRFEPPAQVLWVVCASSSDGERFVDEHRLLGCSIITDSALTRNHPPVPFAYTVGEGRAAQLGSVIAHLGKVSTAEELTRFFEACARPGWAEWWRSATGQEPPR